MNLRVKMATDCCCVVTLFSNPQGVETCQIGRFSAQMCTRLEIVRTLLELEGYVDLTLEINEHSHPPARGSLATSPTSTSRTLACPCYSYLAEALYPRKWVRKVPGWENRLDSNAISVPRGRGSLRRTLGTSWWRTGLQPKWKQHVAVVLLSHTAISG